MPQVIDNLNVASQTRLITPTELKNKIPLSPACQQVVSDSRQTIQNILDGKDHRVFVVVGPCSVHDVDAAIDYAKRLKVLAEKLEDSLYIVMRVYFEKPRTTVGWKGLINDPEMNDSFRLRKG